MKREIIGEVISNKMEKTVVVEVEMIRSHPLYRKLVRKKRKFYAHNPDNKAKIGDRVKIRECRPLSKLKRWVVTEVLKV
ncbi:30S ribosomal protein S17 [Candidatus Calescamantes bacterium]|nr:30S ribosomal protein S17 [Candidatus Calescamantes bacterium]